MKTIRGMKIYILMIALLSVTTSCVQSTSSSKSKKSSTAIAEIMQIVLTILNTTMTKHLVMMEMPTMMMRMKMRIIFQEFPIHHVELFINNLIMRIPSFVIATETLSLFKIIAMNQPLSLIRSSL